ncbi:hypothetical protein [Pseudonocardia alni]|uniref:hypothetical protein n=1 Tax=Pseudonocardia alni TaxID=33907 RepID=UPI003319CC79
MTTPSWPRSPLSDEVRRRLIEALESGAPVGEQPDPSVPFEPPAASPTLAVRNNQIAACGECGAAVLLPDRDRHAAWHVAMVRADLRWLYGDGEHTDDAVAGSGESPATEESSG